MGWTDAGSAAVVVKYRGAHIHGAYVDALGAIVLLRLLESPEVAPHLDNHLRGLAASADPANKAAAEQLEGLLAEARDARRLVKHARDELDGAGSADGTAEPVDPGLGAVSDRPPADHSVVIEVAKRLEVSEEFVRRLCRNKVLLATKRGRQWFIDPSSVEEFVTGRRSIA